MVTPFHLVALAARHAAFKSEPLTPAERTSSCASRRSGSWMGGRSRAIARTSPGTTPRGSSWATARARSPELRPERAHGAPGGRRLRRPLRLRLSDQGDHRDVAGVAGGRGRHGPGGHHFGIDLARMRWSGASGSDDAPSLDEETPAGEIVRLAPVRLSMGRHGWIGLGVVIVAEALLFAGSPWWASGSRPSCGPATCSPRTPWAARLTGRSYLTTARGERVRVALASIGIWWLFEWYNAPRFWRGGDATRGTVVAVPRPRAEPLRAPRRLRLGLRHDPSRAVPHGSRAARERAAPRASRAPVAPVARAPPRERDRGWRVGRAAAGRRLALAGRRSSGSAGPCCWSRSTPGPDVLRGWPISARGTRRGWLALLASGAVCGVLWEFWNYWATARWTYTVPYLGDVKLFEMPVLGYLGFPRSRSSATRCTTRCAARLGPREAAGRAADIIGRHARAIHTSQEARP